MKVQTLNMSNGYSAAMRTRDGGWSVTLYRFGVYVRESWTSGTKVDAIAEANDLMRGHQKSAKAVAS